MTTILWDWNGTLLDDTAAAVAALNDMLERRGLKPMGIDFYRDSFSFPVRPFYETIGMKVADSEWDALAREYHQTYAAKPKHLNPDAIPALELCRKAGARQFIISALRQDLLEQDVAQFGVAGYFEAVLGTDNIDGASKLSCARRLVAQLNASNDFVVIGDALHDKEVADAIGARCVLHGQGTHAAWRLKKAAPTCETVIEATRLALGIQPQGLVR